MITEWFISTGFNFYNHFLFKLVKYNRYKLKHLVVSQRKRRRNMREELSEKTVCVCERERLWESDGAEWDRVKTVLFFQCLCGVIVCRPNSEGGLSAVCRVNKEKSSPYLALTVCQYEWVSVNERTSAGGDRDCCSCVCERGSGTEIEIEGVEIAKCRGASNCFHFSLMTTVPRGGTETQIACQSRHTHTPRDPLDAHFCTCWAYLLHIQQSWPSPQLCETVPAFVRDLPSYPGERCHRSIHAARTFPLAPESPCRTHHPPLRPPAPKPSE